MKIKSNFLILFLALTICLFPVKNAFAGAILEDINELETDIPGDNLVYFFDLRDRETYIQLTNTNFDVKPDISPPPGVSPTPDVGVDNRVHIIIFDVSTDCVENNFFDVYTPNDTHVYNMRDIQTNDGNPSGVVLPDDAYGFVFAQAVDADGTSNQSADIFIGNMRMLDNNGYEYRTNAVVEPDSGVADLIERMGYFNFNTLGGVTLSDIIGVAYDDVNSGPNDGNIEVAEITENFAMVNVDVFDNAENIFSCRNVIYACVNENSPRLEELLEFASDNSDGSASVARSEYGINNAIPHSKGGELLCPGNTVSEGFVRFEVLNFIDVDPDTLDDFVVFIGLNNGNGRGSLDTLWVDNPIFPRGDDDDDADAGWYFLKLYKS